eukprot:jgi/Chlat1/4220/Chrsp27S04305
MAAATATTVSLQRAEFLGQQVRPSLPARQVARSASRTTMMSAKKSKGGNFNKMYEDKSAQKKWVDASGRQSTGKGVYAFRNKYSGNVDEYSPIWTPEQWSSTGDTYAAGVPGLAVWLVTFGAVLLVGGYLVVSTSAL